MLNWLESDLKDRDYFVSFGNYTSEPNQDFILRPLLFNMFPLAQIMENIKISSSVFFLKKKKIYNYADDTPIYIMTLPDYYDPIPTLSRCIEEISDWMCQNVLWLNTDKTEIIIFGPKEERFKVSAKLQSLTLKTTTQARNLGEDSPHHLKNISRNKGLMSEQDLEKHIHVFIFSRLDY